MKKIYLLILIWFIVMNYSFAQTKYWVPSEFPEWDAVWEGYVAVIDPDSTKILNEYDNIISKNEFTVAWGTSYQISSQISDTLNIRFKRETNSGDEWSSIYTSFTRFENSDIYPTENLADIPLEGTVVDLRDNFTLTYRVYIPSTYKQSTGLDKCIMDIRFIDIHGHEIMARNGEYGYVFFNDTITTFDTWVDVAINVRNFNYEQIAEYWASNFYSKERPVPTEIPIPFDTAQVKGLSIYINPGQILNMTKSVDIKITDLAIGKPVYKENCDPYVPKLIDIYHGDGSFTLQENVANTKLLQWKCGNTIIGRVDNFRTTYFNNGMMNDCYKNTLCTASEPPLCSNIFKIEYDILNECGDTLSFENEIGTYNTNSDPFQYIPMKWIQNQRTWSVANFGTCSTSIENINYMFDSTDRYNYYQTLYSNETGEKYLLYQEGAKIYCQKDGNPELWYDFGATVNDTIDMGTFKYKVEKVDTSIYYFSGTFNATTIPSPFGCKVLHLSILDEPGYDEVIWIEGIGDTRGITNSRVHPATDCFSSVLMCSYDGEIKSYSNPDYPNCIVEHPINYQTITMNLEISNDSTIYEYMGKMNWGGNTVTIIEEPSHAKSCTISLVNTEDGYLVYTPATNYIGEDTLTMVRMWEMYNYDTIIVAINVKAAQLKIHYDIKNASTSEGQDGTISIAVLNGIAPYTYIWSNGATTSKIINLKCGEYSVTIEDAAGSTFEKTFTVGVNILGTSEIKGLVNANNQPFSHCSVLLYKNSDMGFKPFLMDQVNDNGSYAFTDLSTGKYLLYAIPDPEFSNEFFPTYAYNSILFDDAHILNVQGDVSGYNINLIPRLFNFNSTGNISGYVINNDSTLITSGLFSYDMFNKESTGYNSKQGVSNFVVNLYKDDELIGFTISKEDGMYSFENIPIGNYSIRIEINGEIYSEYIFEISETQQSVNDADLIIKSETTGIVIPVEDSEIQLYPNPATQTTTVSGAACKLIDVYTNLGKHLQLIENNNSIDVSGLSTGSYIIRIETTDGQILTEILLVR